MIYLFIYEKVTHEPHFNVSHNSSSEEELVVDVSSEGRHVVIGHMNGLERAKVASSRVVRPTLHITILQSE